MNELFHCIDREDVKTLSAILSSKSVDLWNWFELERDLYMTPLGYAIYMNRQKVVEYLVENWKRKGGNSGGADFGIDLYHNCYEIQGMKMTPLSLSRHRKLKNIEELLLRHI